jgi:hypothetical protein
MMAAVMTRPVAACPAWMARLVSPCCCHSSRRLTRNTLVVHGQAEQDRDQHDGQERFDAPALDNLAVTDPADVLSVQVAGS